jgi:hypothetical protein
MALSTKSILGWAGSIRNIFRTSEDTMAAASGTRTPGPTHFPPLPGDPVVKQEPIDSDLEDEKMSDDIQRQPEQMHTLQGQYDDSMPSEPESFESAGPGPQSETDDDDEDEVVELHFTLEERMEMAKKRYPGAKDWARDEERLFEILFSRQDLPMMPSHWSLDFRTFPLTERVFETSKVRPPVVYAHGKNGVTDFTGKSWIVMSKWRICQVY